MKRDMDLIRKIMLRIEEEYVSTAIFNLQVEGYSAEQVATHCKMLYEAGLLSDYKAQYASDELYMFGVGNLTWDGYDYLEKVRDDSVWKKIKDTAKEHGVPLLIDTGLLGINFCLLRKVPFALPRSSSLNPCVLLTILQ